METLEPLLRSKQAQYQYPAEAWRPNGNMTRSEIPDRVVDDLQVRPVERRGEQLHQERRLVLAHRLQHGHVAPQAVELTYGVLGQRRPQLGDR